MKLLRLTDSFAFRPLCVRNHFMDLLRLFRCWLKAEMENRDQFCQSEMPVTALHIVVG